jgi:drug/metabolite transporter (DMT)-like permease
VFAIVLAALSGLVWGAGDFSGGKATQRVPAVASVALSKAVALPVLGLYLVLIPGTPRLASLGWGAVAGLCGGAAMIVFYRALAGGAMAVVAPVSAVTAALVPLVVGLVIETAPGPLALTGAGCAIVAIGLVSLAPHAEAAPPSASVAAASAASVAAASAASVAAASAAAGSAATMTVSKLRLVLFALVSGAGFGLFFVFLNKACDAAGGHGGLWPVLGAHLAALSLCGALALKSRTAMPRPHGITIVWIIVAGVFDMTANALYLLAARDGLLSIVAPVSSLYPVTTVILAVLVDRERMRPVQIAGLGLAATALVLVAS